ADAGKSFEASVSELWLGRRFQLNDRGNYAAFGKSRGERVSVEIDPSFHKGATGDPETFLLKQHAIIQRAAREKWAAGEATVVLHPFSGRLDYHLVTLSSKDLKRSP